MNFLADVFSGCEGQIEIRAIFPVPENSPKIIKQHYFTDPDEAMHCAVSYNGRANVYFGVGSRIRASGTKEDIQEIPATHADLDTPESIKALESFPFKPTVVTETSKGRQQAFWFLKEPLLIEHEGTIAQVEGVLRGIAEVLGSDESVAEIARVMRMPGTKNVKPERNGETCRVISNGGPRYNLSDFIEAGIYREAKSAPAQQNTNPKADELIREGRRNDYLTSHAGAIRRRGMTPEAITAALQAENKARCSPPLSDAEVDAISRSISKYEPGATPAAPARLEASRTTPQQPILADLDVATMIDHGIPPIAWHIEDLLIARTLNYLTGPPKGFKTFLALLMAITLATGKKLADLVVTGQQRILFVEAESPQQIPGRFLKLCRGLGVDPHHVLKSIRFVVPTSRLRLHELAHAEFLIQMARDWGATWVFVDSFVRIHGLDENSSKDMAHLADLAFLPLRDQVGCGVLVIDHPPKPYAMAPRARKEQIRGSWEKLAAADTQIHVATIDTDLGKTLAISVAASRLGPEREEDLYLRMRDTFEGGTVFEKVDAPEIPTPGRPATSKDKALAVINAERIRNKSLTFTQAIDACATAGVSRATATRAWTELNKSQVSEVSEPFLIPETREANQVGIRSITPPKGGDT